MAPTRSYPLAVAQLSLFANLSRNYPLPFRTFHHLSHLLSLCNFLIRSYQSSISIVLHPRPLIPNHSLFSSMTSVLFCRLLQPLPMNVSSPVTSTFILIILQTLSPLSLCLFFLLSILVNTFTSLRQRASPAAKQYIYKRISSKFVPQKLKNGFAAGDARWRILAWLHQTNTGFVRCRTVLCAKSYKIKKNLGLIPFRKKNSHQQQQRQRLQRL